uniref:RRM domain-containing protein n=2 Tax=Macrostomum lignano TaxID=282301 RepID=A0A1I8J981_9PLAT
VKRIKRGVSPGADPSRVIFVREIQSNTSEYELQRSFENYGRVTQLFLMPQRRQALVEFATLLEAEDLIRRQNEGETIIVREMPITEPKKEYLAHEPSKILLFTIFNVRVDVDCETFRKICSSFGQLERVTLTKNVMDSQAIVEFSSVEEAAKAKPQLNGADIYANCNTLRCEYVTPDVFRVVVRDPRCVVDEWLSGRQTTPMIPGLNSMQPQQQQQMSMDPRRVALFDGPPPVGGAGLVNRRDAASMQPAASAGAAAAPGATAAVVSGLLGLASQLTALNVPGLDAQGIIERLAPLTGLLPDQLQQGGVGTGATANVAAAAAATNQRSNNILFLSGLSERMNCDRLFNVLCLYGNHSGQAMAEMLDSRSADACVHYLHNCQLLGKRLIVDYSRQRLLKDVRDAMPLPDGTPSVKEFDISGRNCRNRFLTPEMVKKNKPIDPSSVVYFWGSQPEATEQDIARMLETAEAPQPERIQFLNSENKSGFLFFTNPRDALDAICMANHSELPLGDRNWLIRIRLQKTKAIETFVEKSSKANAIVLKSGQNAMHSGYKRPRIGEMHAMPAAAPPSSLVLISDLLPNTTEQDVLDEMCEYGSVLSIVMIPADSQAVVEFDQLMDSKSLIDNFNSGWPARLRDSPVTLSYARPGDFQRVSGDFVSISPSSILLLTIFRPSGELTGDIFKRVGSQFGRLLRVSVLRGRQPHAVLEYASVEEASRAKRKLNGADIFPDCNTLLCEFASRRVQDILIREGCSLLDEWRQAGLDMRGGAGSGVGGSLLEAVGIGAAGHPDSLESKRQHPGYQDRDQAAAIAGRPFPNPMPQYHPVPRMPLPPHPAAAHAMMAGGPGANPSSHGCLLYLSNLPDALNCDRLFNILCLYGNVRLIKFFAMKRGMAMAEMLDPQSAARCVNFLDNEYLHGTRFSVRLSHEDGIRSVREGGQLADGTPAIKYYDGSSSSSGGYRSLNRFVSERAARKAPPIKPSRTVYFWGHPAQGTEAQLRQLLTETGAPEPPTTTEDGKGVDYFPGDHRSGLLRFAGSKFCNNI